MASIKQNLSDLESAARMIPHNKWGRWLRDELFDEIESLKLGKVTLSKPTLCRIGRLLELALEFISIRTDTPVDDAAYRVVKAVLDDLGCKK